MTATIFLYIAVIGQLYIMSYYYPQKIFARIEYILTNFPASTHPKLYPAEFGEDKARRGLKRYKLITRSTLFIGVVGIIALTATKTPINDAMVCLFGMAQFIPFLLLELSELRQYKLMRTENEDHTRTADLKRRSYFDYVSPFKFSIAVLMLALYLTFNLYRNDFNLSWGSDGLITLVTIIGVHVYFTVVVIWIMYGKKINPHMENKDRDRHIGGVVRTTYYVSIAVSTFMLIYGSLQHYQLDPWEPVALSIYFQLCVFLGIGTMLKTNKLEKLNFDVYRNGTKTT